MVITFVSKDRRENIRYVTHIIERPFGRLMRTSSGVLSSHVRQ